MKIPVSELTDRMRRFRAQMDATEPQWELAAFFGRLNQYYFTGTMQDGVLLIPRDNAPVFWVRRSWERAQEESLFPDIRPMRSFRDAAHAMAGTAGRQAIHLETELVPLALVQRFRKHFHCREVVSLDAQIARVRAVKTSYELAILERVGALHQRMLEDQAPALLREGMSEAEFGCDLYSLMVRDGHEGTVRFSMVNADIAVGQIGFGENSLYPTSFDGPGGCRGLSPSAPVLGCRNRRLRVGDLVFIDVGYYVEGYSTDKTAVFMFGRPLPEEALAAHRACIEVQNRLAAQLKPGTVPSDLYTSTIDSLTPEFRENFMGFGQRRANFLGHGVGLQIDEPPVIAKGFDEPLAEGMVIALEPKKGMPGIGMVGVENTFLVTPAGGRSLTGDATDPILVPC